MKKILVLFFTPLACGEKILIKRNIFLPPGFTPGSFHPFDLTFRGSLRNRDDLNAMPRSL